MRIASSSGKSVLSLAEICSGLQARAHRRCWRRTDRRFVQATCGAGHLGAVRPYDPARQAVLHIAAQRLVPREPRCPGPARRATGRATARSWRGTRSRRGGSPRRFRSSREIVEGARPRRRATSRTPWPCTRSSAISSRSSNDRVRSDSGLAETDRCVGGMPPDLRNHLAPTEGDRPASRAASSLVRPAAIAAQNRTSSARRATGGRPGERSAARNARPEPRPFIDIATSQIRGVATTG